MNEPRGIRAEWAEQVGKPHANGIALDIGVSDTKGKDIEYQIRGVVDVPSLPYGDDERKLLTKVLFDNAEIPHKEKRKFRLHNWVATDGGSGVRIDKFGTIPVITAEDIIGEVKVFTPPDVEEISEGEQIRSEKYDEWVQEYSANRYCRYESRQELNQRYQDIQVNTQVLKPSGKIGLTTDEFWYQLMQHIIIEMILRGQPPTVWNHDPRVKISRPFFDGELCRKAARVVSARGTAHDVIVKYGKRQHMEDLYSKGLVYMNVASQYDKSTHNQAVRDDERSIVGKGGYFPMQHPKSFYNKDTIPDNIQECVDKGEIGFSAIYKCPSLKSDQYADISINMLGDYWMFCMADVLDQRLFADFEADSCVIIRRKPFIERLLSRTGLLLPNVHRIFGYVNYIDPLGALSTNVPLNRSLPVHMTKVFRYAYQGEVRFVCLPKKFQERLETRPLVIGPISDISELIVL